MNNKRGNTGKTLFTLSAIAVGILSSQLLVAQTPGEKPLGEMTIHSAGKPVKPIYKSDVNKEIEGIKASVDKLAAEVNAAKIDSEKDSTEKMFKGSISLDRHRAEIAGLVDKVTVCKAAMENAFKDKEDSGKATPEDKAKFDKCRQHCDKVVTALNSMHNSASVLGTATRKNYVLDGWEKHKKVVAEAQAVIAECPTVVHEAMSCCKTETLAKGDKKSK